MRIIKIAIVYFFMLHSVQIASAQFTSKVPASTNQEKVPAGFLGVWQEEEKAADVVKSSPFRDFVIVKPYGENQFLLQLMEYSPFTTSRNNYESEIYLGYLTKFSNVYFMHLRKMKDSQEEEQEEESYSFEEEYVIMRVNIEDDRVIMKDLVSNGKQFDNTADLENYLVANLGNSFFYKKGYGFSMNHKPLTRICSY